MNKLNEKLSITHIRELSEKYDVTIEMKFGENFRTIIENDGNMYESTPILKNQTFFHDLETKGLLYEGVSDSKERRNRQFVMNVMLKELTKWLAPMTPYLCEDVYQFTDNKEFSSVFYETLK